MDIGRILNVITGPIQALIVRVERRVSLHITADSDASLSSYHFYDVSVQTLFHNSRYILSNHFVAGRTKL